MDINHGIESPFHLKISFNTFLQRYEEACKSDNIVIANNARGILKIADEYPELREGFSDATILQKREKEIGLILQDVFSPLLTKNEIKTASVPLHNLIFNSSERFKSIIKTAGKDFELQINYAANDVTYIITCTIILSFYYGYDLNFKRPFYYKIPDANGVLRYYKIAYNADFCEVIPTKNTKKITREDYDELLENYDDIDLWKEKFPPNSYQFNGFVISNIFDVTDDQSISNIKSSLISEGKRKDKRFMKGFHDIFRSLLGINDLKVGFSLYNEEEQTFERVYGSGTTSFLLGNREKEKCESALCSWSYNKLLNEKASFSVSDVDQRFSEAEGRVPHITSLHEQGIKSAIFAPIANAKGLMGIIEIVSKKRQALNSVNANKLIDVMPFIVSVVERSKNEEQNMIEAIIQQECTSIHPSVYWKFVDAARQFLNDKVEVDNTPSFKEIVFENIYPLFGQMDVKGSSNARNLATQKDLLYQLSILKDIVLQIAKHEPLPIYEQLLFKINNFVNELETNFKVDSEQSVVVFFKKEIQPLLKFQATKLQKLKLTIDSYFDKIDSNLDLIYHYRKDYDDTVMLINKNMAAILDKKQKDAQAMYPHYFERYKTDGVEHNMYIGESITKADGFNKIYLYNLRLWQIQVMCEMENEFYNNQHIYPIKLDVASMILVFNQPLSIRFRMDEKQFDVDGTYNARYEVVKKRVDKALIKGTNERITQNGKICIIYSQKEDEEEYLQYIKFLQNKSILDKKIEIVQLQNLQGVSGLKAIRVDILYHGKDHKKFYTYNDLMKEIKA